MITNRLKKLLLENNITIDYKISSTEFNTKKEFIINMYQSKGYESINDSLSGMFLVACNLSYQKFVTLLQIYGAGYVG